MADLIAPLFMVLYLGLNIEFVGLGMGSKLFCWFFWKILYWLLVYITFWGEVGVTLLDLYTTVPGDVRGLNR
jgi:hypothetical protein